MTKFSSQMKWSHIFKIQYWFMFSKILKQQFTYTIKLSQFDSSPDKAPHYNPLTYFFYLNHCIELLNLLMLKILEITMDIHHFTKLPLLGFFNKKSPKLIKIWKLFFKKHNKTNTKISGRLSQPWQLSRSGTPSMLLAQLKIIYLQ